MFVLGIKECGFESCYPEERCEKKVVKGKGKIGPGKKNIKVTKMRLIKRSFKEYKQLR